MEISSVLFYLPLLVVYAIGAIYAERKVSAFIQDRLGPMETGKYGLAQSIADLLKLLQKEDIVPAKADKLPFKIAPVMIFVVVFAGFAVLPVAPAWPGAGLSTGVFFLLAIVALDVIAIIIAGWSSNNKFSTLGSFRSAAQIISYEIPLGLSVLCVCMFTQTLDLQEISILQSTRNESALFFGFFPTSAYGGFLSWNIFQFPVLLLVWVVFFIASLAESNRAPFDLPEAESELVAGFHTEYSGFRWAVIMLAEYAMMLLVSILGVILFFGSWNSPLPDIGPLKLYTWTMGELGWQSTVWGIFWLTTKSFILVGIQMWIRWTLPRLRIDQLMNLSWKYLTPFGLTLVILTGFWKLISIS